MRKVPKIRLKARHFLILILVLAYISSHYGFWENTNSYENLLGFFLFTLPLSIILLIISVVSKKRDTDMGHKKVSLLGIYFSIILVSMMWLYTMYLVIDYLFL